MSESPIKPKKAQKVDVPSELRDFLREVETQLKEAGDDAFEVGEDIVQWDNAYGGRLEKNRFSFTFFPDDAGLDRWELLLDRKQLTAIASGKTKKVELFSCESPLCGNRFPSADAVCEDCDGLFEHEDADFEPESLEVEPMLIWGLEPGEAHLLDGEAQLDELLDLFARLSQVEQPKLVRLVRKNGDRMIIGQLLEEAFLCAISEDMDSPLPVHATSIGNDAQVETTMLRDLTEPISLMFKYFISAKAARQAIRLFFTNGELSPEVTWEQSVPGDWENEARLLVESHPPSAYKAGSRFFTPPAEALTLEKLKKRVAKTEAPSKVSKKDRERLVQALRFIAILVEHDHLEFKRGFDPKSLAQGVADLLARKVPLGDKAQMLIDWLFEQKGVEEVYIGDDELVELLSMW
ncbi:MAG: hypothetical protein KC609_00840 [Myxococcales bacterium]|nr:hypothetical protein [Myxococcales bacterium]